MPKYPCGCVNEIDPEWGVLRSVLKCPFHKSRMGRGGADYYLNELKGSKTDDRWEREFVYALKQLERPLLQAGPYDKVLEIGAGIGLYCDWLQRLGYQYNALEMDKWACEWMRKNREGVQIYDLTFEEFLQYEVRQTYPLILAAHVIEHFKHAPQMIQEMFKLLVPGGRALLLIPNDEDKANPDHLWFFSKDDFQRVLERVGFEDVRIMTQRIVKHEDFLYASAMKPR